MKIDIFEWIDTGELAGIIPGDQKQHIRKKWGDPMGWASTSDSAEIQDCMNADIWSHGVWTTFYEGDILDGISCCFESLDQVGWHFDLSEIDPLFFQNVGETEKILTRQNIQYIIVPKIFHLQNSNTGEVVERKRRLAAPVIMAGKKLATRIIFTSQGGVGLISNPVGLRRQVVGFSRLDSDNYVFIPERKGS
ncbi:hypothetical protein INH39_28885 [Massilia violaceinigra]|uniref:Uncharacterized protein n=1 Tax=Massilia violaceinigra TaxID=2045208 RepID=A0ABY4A4T0_9BURK|nr:hypothetical protein [Massilia violaceinigra]UOD29377.1 hypothetical protein INH39_28885 [Massilia violaceinigra]